MILLLEEQLTITVRDLPKSRFGRFDTPLTGKRLFAIMTSSRCLKLAAISITSRAFFLSIVSTMLLTVTNVYAFESLTIGSHKYVLGYNAMVSDRSFSSVDDIRFMETMIFFSACQTPWCKASGHLITEVFNHPELRDDKSAGGGISLVNEFLFKNEKLLEKSDKFIQNIWTRNIIPKLEKLINKATTRHH